MTSEFENDMVVSTIVPALNEEGNIDDLCRLYAEMLQSASFKGELIHDKRSVPVFHEMLMSYWIRLRLSARCIR